MALNQTQAWMIAYDIVCDRRRARVHKAVSEFAIPVQYSLYLALASQNQMNAFCQTLQPLIHPKEDDIRVYRVPDDPEFWMLGYSRCEVVLSPNGDLAAGVRDFLRRLTQPRPQQSEYTVAESLEDDTEEATLNKVGKRRSNPLQGR